jgi:hypothetical protein
MKELKNTAILGTAHKLWKVGLRTNIKFQNVYH